MDSVKEGSIRQSTDNPLAYELRMLTSGDKVMGRGVTRRGDMVYIKTNFEDIPIYAFKMNGNLMKVLQQNRGDWYE
jgi:hypothetical protein